MKSKVILIAFLLLSILSNTIAQQTDYNKIILPTNAKDISIKERLVQLAWLNNPRTAMSEELYKIAVFNEKSAKWSWLDYISIQGNINEFTLDPGNERSAFYPRYNFSVGFTLGVFAKQPLAIKTAKTQSVIADEDINLLKLQIRSEVLQSYETYILSKEIYEIQSLVTEDLHSNFLITEERFKNGEENLQTYNQMLENYNRQKINSLNAVHDYMSARIRLEELIGLSLDEVL